MTINAWASNVCGTILLCVQRKIDFYAETHRIMLEPVVTLPVCHSVEMYMSRAFSICRRSGESKSIFAGHYLMV